MLWFGPIDTYASLGIGSQKRGRRATIATVAGLIFLVPTLQPIAASSESLQRTASRSPKLTVLHSFRHYAFGGPDGVLAIDRNGSLYGTTTGGRGQVFRLEQAASGQQWKITLLYREQGFSSKLVPGLIGSPDGTLYGTRNGGDYADPSVYMLTPPAAGETTWKKTILHSFFPDFGTYADEYGGLSRLTMDPDGALYGTELYGGDANRGMAFKLTPPLPGGQRASWIATTIRGFRNLDNGAYPSGGLAFDQRGALYGTTHQGGRQNLGTVYTMLPPASGQSRWRIRVLHHFRGGADGSRPEGGVLVADRGRTLYGTTHPTRLPYDFCCGTIFQLTWDPGQRKWKRTTIFRGTRDVAVQAGLISDRDGSLIGTTRNLKKGGCCGTVFKLAQPTAGQTRWKMSVLHEFSGADGRSPNGSLIYGPGRKLFGTTESGGAFGHGTVFKLRL
jgi:uncharacterized repeat protein (TIGR03803 family)